MCYSKPGPRCTNHAIQRLQLAENNLAECKKQVIKAEKSVRSAEVVKDKSKLEAEMATAAEAVKRAEARLERSAELYDRSVTNRTKALSAYKDSREEHAAAMEDYKLTPAGIEELRTGVVTRHDEEGNLVATGDRKDPSPVEAIEASIKRQEALDELEQANIERGERKFHEAVESRFKEGGVDMGVLGSTTEDKYLIRAFVKRGWGSLVLTNPNTPRHMLKEQFVRSDVKGLKLLVANPSLTGSDVIEGAREISQNAPDSNRWENNPRNLLRAISEVATFGSERQRNEFREVLLSSPYDVNGAREHDGVLLADRLRENPSIKVAGRLSMSDLDTFREAGFRAANTRLDGTDGSESSMGDKQTNAEPVVLMGLRDMLKKVGCKDEDIRQEISNVGWNNLNVTFPDGKTETFEAPNFPKMWLEYHPTAEKGKRWVMPENEGLVKRMRSGVLKGLEQQFD